MSAASRPPIGARVDLRVGDCHERAKEVVPRLASTILGLAFVDPQGFEVKFNLFKTLATRRIDVLYFLGSRVEDSLEVEARRRYVTRSTRQRLHQQSFRERVLAAYQACCAICRLRHQELLEAAHILPDGHPRGEPIVANGLALCKLHHAAFDTHLLGVDPDLTVVLRPDILREPDGQMLSHGLQAFHGSRIFVPQRISLRPRREFLAERFALFRKAG